MTTVDLRSPDTAPIPVQGPGTVRAPGPEPFPEPVPVRPEPSRGAGSRVAPGPPEEAARWFRADVEGLRAVALVAVLLFHATVPHVGGGFVGVDVFFVISGFLITSLLVRELERTGTVSLRAFYARRARRILPAASLVIAVTVIAVAVLLPPLVAGDTARDALAALFQVANLQFIQQQVDYAAAGRGSSALLHYWSLSVEEQFYLIWAPLLLVTCRLGGRARRPLLVAVVALLSVGSFAVALHWTAASQAWAYLGSPARAWQFGAGALVALGAPVLDRVARSTSGALAGWLLGWAGLAAILGSVVLITERTPYPGSAALYPTLGAAAVIAAGAGAAGPRWRGGVGSLLSTRPLRAVGRWSFSWYLWHWPALVLAGAVLGWTAWPPKLLVVGLCGIAAAATLHWVERPLQRARSVRARPRGGLALGAASTATALVVVLAVGSLAMSADDAELAPGAVATFRDDLSAGPVSPSPRRAREDTPAAPDGCTLRPEQVSHPRCRVETPGGGGAPVVLFGDSHAEQWFPFARALGRRLGAPVVVLTKSGCPIASIPALNPQLGRDFTECYAWRAAMLKRIEVLRPRLVVVASSNRYLAGGAPTQAWAPVLRAARRARGTVVYVADTPFPGRDMAACMSGALDDWSRCSFPSSGARRPDPLLRAAARGALPRVYAVSAWTELCPAESCPAARGGVLLYRDDSHLTNTAAELLVPALVNQLTAAGALPAARAPTPKGPGG